MDWKMSLHISRKNQNRMSAFKYYFKKQGGIQLVKDYWRAGVLIYAVKQLLLTGRSKKSLEILRLGVKMRIHNKLKNKYEPILKNFDQEYIDSELSHSRSNKVWFFWMQGLENAPKLVQRCYQSLSDNLQEKEMILVTENNIKEYVEFPDFIMNKVRNGNITITHLSDLLRMELLIKYGGTWIDSTVLCTGKNIPSYMLDSDFFMFQNLRPGNNGNVVNVSSWLMTSCQNNRILLAVREMIYTYWKNNDKLIDYFLFHHFIMIASNYYSDDWNKMIQFPNSFPHVLLLMLFEPFNQEKWDAVTSSCPFHKLAYKRSAEEMAKKGTYYEYIMNNMN